MTAYALTDLARQDLHDIWDYIAADNLPAADRMMAKLEKSFELLARFPKSGRARTELRNTLRAFTASGYLIVYRKSIKEIQIVRVLHGRRDIRAEMGLPPL